MSALRPPGGLRQRLVHRVHGQVVAGKGRAGLLRQIRQPPARWVVTPKRLRPGRPRSSHHRQAAHTSSHGCQWAAVRSARNIDDRGSHGVSVVGRPAVEAGARGAAGPGGFKGSVVLREGGRARAVQDSGSERALGVLEPFVELGWEPACWAAADVMLQADGYSRRWTGAARTIRIWRRSTRAATSRSCWSGRGRWMRRSPFSPASGPGMAVVRSVELTEGQNRDERVLELLAPKAERARSACGVERWNLDASSAQDLQAQVWNARAA